MKETALLLGRDRSLVGILTESRSPAAEPAARPGVLLLNAGLVHHIGPNRLYVHLARRLADMGYVVLRFDFSGIGDSGPRRDMLPVAQSMVDETRQAMDCLEQVKGLREFILMGICAGAGVASQAAVADDRVTRAVLINPMLPGTRRVERMRRFHYYRRQALFNPRSWMRLLLMQSSYRDLWRMLRYEIGRRLFPEEALRDEPSQVIEHLRASFRTLKERDTRMLLIFAAGELGDQYFNEVVGPEYQTLKDQGYFTTTQLACADHLVTPLASQAQLLDIVTRWVA